VQHAYLFCYGGGEGEGRGGGHTIYATSKCSAILTALRVRWPVRVVLIWHLGLLKLLPFFRAPGARVALFLHGIEAWERQPWLTRSLLRRVDLFLSNSDYTWQRFTHAHPWCAHAAHQTTHLGLATSLPEAVSVPGTPPVVFMLGRLLRSENYKGHWEMIQAWPRVLQRIPEAQLWIAGDGDLRGPLEQLVMERGLGGKIRFWGWVSEAKKQELLAHCRCLALPSRSEGFGLVYLEAMRLGRPCLVSTLDAGREVVHPPEAGLAADPQRSEELAEAVCRLLSDGPAWAAWSHQARERYAIHFTARHFQDRFLAALSPLL
jgi:phosphatidylinositol alpha-1,6-mannosyltransferase